MYQFGLFPIKKIDKENKTLHIFKGTECVLNNCAIMACTIYTAFAQFYNDIFWRLIQVNLFLSGFIVRKINQG